MTQMYCKISVLILAISFAMVLSCSSNEKSTVKEKKTEHTMANPAAEKCIEDGFELKPMVEHGVPKGYLCVNPETGLQCEIWQYYRGECRIQ